MRMLSATDASRLTRAVTPSPARLDTAPVRFVDITALAFTASCFPFSMQCPGHLLRYRLNTSEADTINKSLIPHLSVPAVPPILPPLLSHSLP